MSIRLFPSRPTLRRSTLVPHRPHARVHARVSVGDGCARPGVPVLVPGATVPTTGQPMPPSPIRPSACLAGLPLDVGAPEPMPAPGVVSWRLAWGD